MGVAYGSRITTDKLVFSYDMGNTKRSYIGQPSTNEFVSSMLTNNYGGIGTLQSGTGDPFGTSINPVYRKTGKIRFGNSNGTDYGTLYNGTTYTFSIYLRLVPTELDPDSMEFDICDRSNSTSFTGNLIDNLTNDWQRFSVTALHNNSTNYHFIDIGENNGTGVFEWSCPQIDVGSVATPYIKFESTQQTRSNTEGLLDLMGNQTITLSNMTYNADGTFEMDGSSNYFQFPSPLNGYRYNWSIEFVSRSDATSGVILCPSNAGIDQSIRYNGDRQVYIAMVRIADNNGHSHTNSDVDVAGEYNHYVITRTPNRCRIYRNGKLSKNEADTQINAEFGGTWRVGQRGNSTNFLDGNVPLMRVYKRVLSEAEVQGNYSTVKERFE
jgi:hypothetical protein